MTSQAFTPAQKALRDYADNIGISWADAEAMFADGMKALLTDPGVVEAVARHLEATADRVFDRDALYPHQANCLAQAALAELRKMVG